MYEDEYYMREAIAVARKGIQNNEFPFGCCLVTKNHIIKMENTCFSKKNAILHAEINAINKMLQLEQTSTLEDATLYATTEPCVMCMGAINWVKIQKIVCGMSIYDSRKYGFQEINIAIEQLLERFPYEIEVKTGVLHNECVALYQEWAEKNRILYRFLKQKKFVRGRCDLT